MLLTNEERQEIFEKDLEKIRDYLIKRFKLKLKKNPESLLYKSSGLEMKYIITPEKEELEKLSGKGSLDELKRFNDELWDKLQMFSVRAFVVYNNKAMITIDYKSNMEILTFPKVDDGSNNVHTKFKKLNAMS
ncbi:MULTISPECIES: hypothetical protein [Methanobacterium]|uniref:Uncharacterized protein n=1 Tax=Methanobacterium veterum TaxID=408577 RepID=A0A9E5DPQ1_9EURY|nr:MULTISPECIES: hypothetical protein [Methanobacterium]MCZ3366664.1 hypothetical protein [Methanobacterium veterum]MCZ3374191.1 hypothetical protein [Methanobacterium veterum]